MHCFKQVGDSVRYYHASLPEKIYLQPMHLDLPNVDIAFIRCAEGNDKIGYELTPNTDTEIVVTDTHLHSGGSTLMEPRMGLPHLQIYTGDTGVLIVAAHLTPFLESLEPTG